MFFKRLNLKNFRCHRDLTIEFNHNPFYIQGCNGSGKTSISEALFTLFTLKSFRRINIKDAISYAESYLRISAQFEMESERELVYFYDGERSLMRDGEIITSAADFSYIIPVVCYSPGFETLFSGDQQERRSSVDRFIYYNNKAHAADVKLYNALLARKRAELSAERANADVISALNAQLEPLSGRISAARDKLIEEINNEMLNDPLYNEMFAGLSLAIEVNGMRKAAEEIKAARPLGGCHKDLIYLKNGDAVVEKFQSFGQKKSALLFILCHISKIIEKKRNQSIILILDDFEAALDNNRVNLLERLLLNETNGLNRLVILTGIEFTARKAALIL
jgi:DNA replication and repair protein RecF